jgi:hypothetical protein
MKIPILNKNKFGRKNIRIKKSSEIILTQNDLDILNKYFIIN